MNNKYRVLKSFTDKETGQVYSLGTFYEGNRAAELERGGYIAPEGSEKDLQANAAQNSAGNKTDAKSGVYSMANGERITLQEAQKKAQTNQNMKAADLDRNETKGTDTGSVASGAPAAGANVESAAVKKLQADQSADQAAIAADLKVKNKKAD